MPTFIALPNGTIVDAETIIMVEARDERKSMIDDEVVHKPAAVLVYGSPQKDVLQLKVDCQTLEEAINVRDRIISATGRRFPINKI